MARTYLRGEVSLEELDIAIDAAIDTSIKTAKNTAIDAALAAAREARADSAVWAAWASIRAIGDSAAIDAALAADIVASAVNDKAAMHRQCADAVRKAIPYKVVAKAREIYCDD
jgi:hypothetical protein